MRIRIRNINNCILGTVLLLLAAFLFHETYFFREVHSFSFGPRIFPRVILGLIGLCSCIMILQSLTFEEKPAEKKQEEDKNGFDLSVFAMRVGMIALLVIYIAVLPIVGYLPGSIVFLFLTMLLLGERTLKHVALYAVVSVVTTFTLSYIFGTLLRFFLP